MPSLWAIMFDCNELNDEGLASLAGVLPNLSFLSLVNNRITDKGLESLLANNMLCKSLEGLDLRRNLISDAGCATFVSALQSGRFPSLKVLTLADNEASDAAVQAVQDALEAAIAANDRGEVTEGVVRWATS